MCKFRTLLGKVKVLKTCEAVGNTGLLKMIVGGTVVQRQFCTKFRKQPPSDNSIRRWYAKFQETGCVFIPELKVRIRTAIETITADMRDELDYRVIEHL